MTNQGKNQERRRFSRIPFHIAASLLHAEKETLNVEVADLSLHGVLIEKPSPWYAPKGTEFTLTLTLENSDTQLDMHVAVAHIDDDVIGFECKSIDLESISHLRRLVELNLGNSDILNRELTSLIDS